ncbi:MAG: hypothetical protein ACRED9_08225 [Caulobacteraceae bacterium]
MSIPWYNGPCVGTPEWLAADVFGSTIASSNSSGGATATYAYEYGNPAAWGGPRYRYTGQIEIPEAGLYDYKARAYAPGLGVANIEQGYEDERNRSFCQQ